MLGLSMPLRISGAVASADRQACMVDDNAKRTGLTDG
jgi:hypothetical protein